MSHRTSHLPPTNFFAQIVRELRYHEASRQLFAIGLIILFTVFGAPKTAWLYYCAMAVAAVGTVIRAWASGHVKKNKILATDGPYALVRHPLYVGNILMLFGFAFAAELWWPPLLVVALLYFYYPPAIEYEDRKLRNIFGDAWENWSKQTKALIPSFPPSGKLATHWSFRQSLIGNGEPYCGVCRVLRLRAVHKTVIKLPQNEHFSAVAGITARCAGGAGSLDQCF